MVFRKFCRNKDFTMLFTSQFANCLSLNIALCNFYRTDGFLILSLKPWHSLDIVKSSQGTFVAKHSRMDLHSNECGHFQNRIIKLNKKLYENT